MSLLQELLIEAKKKNVVKATGEDKRTNVNNFVAKHAVNKSGAGQHVDKVGSKAPRNRQNRQWKKETRGEM